MKKHIGKFFVAKLLFGALALGGIGVFAAQNPSLGRVLRFARPEVAVEMKGTVARDGQDVPLDKTESVRTGETLDWTIVSVNNGGADAANYRVVGQIPKGTAFVAGSASGGSNVVFSIDGGKTFSSAPTIEEKQPDGTVKTVLAPASAYTQIRFEWTSALAPGSSLEARYKVRVK